jgi:hypothetical protein
MNSEVFYGLPKKSVLYVTALCTFATLLLKCPSKFLLSATGMRLLINSKIFQQTSLKAPSLQFLGELCSVSYRIFGYFIEGVKK